MPVGTNKILLESNAILLQLRVFHILDLDNNVDSLGPCLNKFLFHPLVELAILLYQTLLPSSSLPRLMGSWSYISSLFVGSL